jgi:hypothetical protein
MLTPTRYNRPKSSLDIPQLFPSVTSSSKYPLVPVAALSARESAPRLPYTVKVMTTVATARSTPGRSVVLSIRRCASRPLTKFKLERTSCQPQAVRVKRSERVSQRPWLDDDVKTESVLVTA